MEPAACCDRERLTEYMLGKLNENEMEKIGQHIADCSKCRALADELEPVSDELMALLQRPVAVGEYLDEPEYRRALAKADAMKHFAEFSSQPDDPAADETPPPEQLGQYRILDLIGKGGMGTVYRARHEKLKRLVALKVLSSERVQDKHALTRFDREMETIAQLDHPNIVRALDAGEDQGFHYLAMDLVHGCNLARLVRNLGPLPIADACELARQAAIALEYIHNHEMVHRDIKPSNLMLGIDGQVKLLDLGLSRLREQQTDDRDLTATGIMMGTYDYMSPEQCRDSRSVKGEGDLYSLGCTLYELLCGRPPFSGAEFDTRGKKIAAHLTTDPPPIREQRPDTPKKLAGVVHQLLAKEPADRVATAGDLASALERFTDDSDLVQLIQRATEKPAAQVETAKAHEQHTGEKSAPAADTEPTRERQRQSLKDHESGRRRRIVATAALAGILLLGVVLTIHTSKGKLIIETEDSGIEISVSQGGDEVTLVDADAGWQVRLDSGQYDVKLKGGADRFELDRKTIIVRRWGKVRVRVTRKQPTSVASAAVQITPEPVQLTPGDSFSPLAMVTRPRAMGSVKSWTVETRRQRSAGSQSCPVEFDPEGALVATGGDDGTIRLWDVATGRLSKCLIGHAGRVSGLSWAPKGDYLASGSMDRTIRIWDTRTGRQLRCHQTPDHVLSVAWSLGGDVLAWGGNEGFLAFWNVNEENESELIQAHNKTLCVRWAPNGKILASAGYDGTVKFWNGKSEEPLYTFATDRSAYVGDVCWSSDGTELAVTADASSSIVWVLDGATGRQIRRLAEDWPKGKTAVAWAPASKVLAIAGKTPGEVALWDVETDRQIGSPGTAFGPSIDVAYSPAGDSIAITDTYGGTYLWRLPQPGDQAVATLSEPLPYFQSLGFSANGQVLATVDEEGKCQLWETKTGNYLKEIPCLTQKMALSPDGSRVAACRQRPWKLAIWDTESGAVTDLPDPSPVKQLAWSPDGKMIGVGTDKLKIRDAASGKLLHTFDPDGGMLFAWSPDSNLLAVADDSKLRIFDSTTGEESWTLDLPTAVSTKEFWAAGGTRLAWSPDGASLACAVGKLVHVFAIKTRNLASSLGPYGGQVHSLWWLSEGGQLACLHEDKIAIRDAATGDTIRSGEITKHGGEYPHNVAVSPTAGVRATVHPDAIEIRPLCGDAPAYTIVCLPDKKYAVLSPDGNYRGSDGIEQELVIVALTGAGQETLSPDEFSKKYGWNNNPEKVRATAGIFSETEMPAVDAMANRTNRVPDTPDRQVAEWVLSVGGEVKLRIGDKTVDVRRLPLPSERFNVVGINLKYREYTCTDDDVLQLLSLSTIEDLELWTTDLTDHGLKTLSQLSTVRRLGFGSKRVTDEGLKHLGQMPNLEKFGGSCPNVTDRGFAELCRPQVYYLDLSSNNISDAFMRNLPRCPDLRELHLNDTQISDAGLVPLTGMQSLRTLHIAKTSVTDAGLVHVPELPKLQSLDVSEMRIGEKGVAHLIRCRSIQELRLHHTDISDTDLARLASLTQLRVLDVRATQVTDAVVANFRKTSPNCLIYYGPEDTSSPPYDP